MIKKDRVKLAEFNASLPLDAVMEELKGGGYSDAFLQDVREGFKTSIPAILTDGRGYFLGQS